MKIGHPLKQMVKHDDLVMKIDERSIPLAQLSRDWLPDGGFLTLLVHLKAGYDVLRRIQAGDEYSIHNLESGDLFKLTVESRLNEKYETVKATLMGENVFFYAISDNFDKSKFPNR